MVKMQCRHCGAEVDSDEKARKCRHCGDLFPFECAYCGKHMRPPIPIYPVERYFNDEGQPLCADHYQRQCPECNTWFRADENPGFFMCLTCTAKRQSEVESQSPDDADISDAQAEPAATPRSGGCGASVVVFLMFGITLLWSATHALWAAWSQAH